MSNDLKVGCRIEKMAVQTYPEPEREKLPMYCDSRIHQRTSGKVYPNAIVNAVVRDRKIAKDYIAIVLENEFIELVILPELGGRIFSAKDKSNGYDFFYRQHVIKPALIGLFGSWISGGAEFNWPMHHRPSTFMPTDFSIERDADGSATVWLSEHEPLDRMKGMVGIRLRPGQALFETRARLFNRTALPNSFLWWENIAVPVNESYQLFFPQDVNYVNFHYKKSVTSFPLADSMFNGIDYRNSGNDIRWHKNTVNPTSYFSARSNFDFFGGYDHGKRAGVVHVANRYISPGKKMFTWAYNQLSKSWENALTDTDGAYAELMAGVYTDNQPDFSWIEPYEVKEFSQFWFPFKDIGEPKNANESAAVNFLLENGECKLMVYPTKSFACARLSVSLAGEEVHCENIELQAGKAAIASFKLACNSIEAISVKLNDMSGCEIIAYRNAKPIMETPPKPQAALPSPYQIEKPEELFMAGTHLKQYRDPLVSPDIYWKQAVALDSELWQASASLGFSALKEARFEDAERHFKAAIASQTKFNPNPRDGEAFYGLGLALKRQGKPDEAYEAFYKATWSFAWRSAGYYSVAQIDCERRDFVKAECHLNEALKTNAQNQKAANLLAAAKRISGDKNGALTIVKSTLAGDPLDYWALNELSLLEKTERPIYEGMHSDASQTALDIACDYIDAGLFADAASLLEGLLESSHGKSASPMTLYALSWLRKKLGDNAAAEKAARSAQAKSPDCCFPVRDCELEMLRDAVNNSDDARAAYYLGNLLYGRMQREEALGKWLFAESHGETYYALYRNIGMALYNQKRDGEKALRYLKEALTRSPGDAQLVFELNYLMQLLNRPFSERQKLLDEHSEAVGKRDALHLELVKLANLSGDSEKAVSLLKSHVFTPCEGGEHAIAEQWIFAHFKLGRTVLKNGEIKKALALFQQGQSLPDNLGAGVWNSVMHIPCRLFEAHCLKMLGDISAANGIYTEIADIGLDSFRYMYLPALDCYRAMAMQKLGKDREAETLLRKCLASWEAERKSKDFGHFKATPFFLSFLEEPSEVRRRHYGYLSGLAHLGLGDASKAMAEFDDVLSSSSSELWAALERSLLT